MKLNSIRARLTALFVFIFGSTLIILSALGYRFFSQVQQTDFDAALYNHVVDLASAIQVNRFGDVTLPLLETAGQQKFFPFSLLRSHVQLRDELGGTIGRSETLGGADIPLRERNLQELSEKGYSFDLVQGRALEMHENAAGGPDGEPRPTRAKASDTSYRVLSYLVLRPGVPALVLQVAAPMTFLDSNKQKLREMLYIAIPLVLVIATVGGLYLSRRALAPIVVMTRKADAIEVRDLSARVPVPTTDDEVSRLGITLNRLLERIEQSMKVNERFVADASHQLRTPLAILRGELDLFISRKRSEEELLEFLQSASSEIDSLSRLVENLLVLARMDTSGESLPLRPVRLDELLMETVAAVQRLADRRSLRLRVRIEENGPEATGENFAHESRPPADPCGRFELAGDAELLKTLLMNLLENAVKYSPDGESIDVRAADSGSELAVTIRNAGEPIPAGELSKLFNRFYRGGGRKSFEGKRIDGFGLGLPIAASIARAHRGTIEVQSSVAAGTVFRVRMKKS